MSSTPLHPFFLKGALVQITDLTVGFVPNVILFQYNPHTLTRSLRPQEAPSGRRGEDGERAERAEPAGSGQNQPWDPIETFDLDLELDATDDLSAPRDTNALAPVLGVADRIASLEMLTYPKKALTLTGAVGGALGGAWSQQGLEVPVVLFIWGPLRILPVRVTGMSVTETQFNAALSPDRATVRVSLRVMTDNELEEAEDRMPSFARTLAIAAYKFTLAEKELLSMYNLVNTGESVADMLSSIG